MLNVKLNTMHYKILYYSPSCFLSPTSNFLSHDEYHTTKLVHCVKIT